MHGKCVWMWRRTPGIVRVTDTYRRYEAVSCLTHTVSTSGKIVTITSLFHSLLQKAEKVHSRHTMQDFKKHRSQIAVALVTVTFYFVH